MQSQNSYQPPLNIGYVAPATNSWQPPQRKRNILLPVMILLSAGLLALGTGAYAAYTYYLETPLKVQSMLTALDQVTSADLSTKVMISGSVKGLDPAAAILGAATESNLLVDLTQPSSVAAQTVYVSLDATFNGKLEQQQNIIRQFDGSLEIKAKGDYELTNANAGGSVTIAMDARQTPDEVLFFRITKVPQLGLSDTSEIVNKWIKINLAELLQINNSDFDYQKYKEQTQQAALEYNAVWKQHREAMFVFSKSNLIKDLNNRTLENITFTVNEAVLRTYLIDMLKVTQKYASQLSAVSPAAFAAGSEQQTEEELAKEVDQLLKYVRNIKGDLWVNPKDNLPYQATISYEIADIENLVTSINTSIQLTVNQYNQSFNVESPAEFEDLNSLMSQTYQHSGLQKAQSDAISVQADLEAFMLRQNRYPSSLSELYPDNIYVSYQSVSAGLITYQPTNANQDYILCYASPLGEMICQNSDFQPIEPRRN